MSEPDPKDAERPRRGGRKMVDWTQPDADEPEAPGRDERRRAGRQAADEAGELAERLMSMNDQTFDLVPLDTELGEALRRARAMRSDSGQRRTIRAIAGLLRLRDRGPLQAALQRIEAGKGLQDARFHGVERWRERLLREGDAALDALLAEHPQADRQVLRTLLRQARKEQEQGQSGRAFRELFRALRDLGG